MWEWSDLISPLSKYTDTRFDALSGWNRTDRRIQSIWSLRWHFSRRRRSIWRSPAQTWRHFRKWPLWPDSMGHWLIGWRQMLLNLCRKRWYYRKESFVYRSDNHKLFEHRYTIPIPKVNPYFCRNLNEKNQLENEHLPFKSKQAEKIRGETSSLNIWEDLSKSIYHAESLTDAPLVTFPSVRLTSIIDD